MTSWFSEQVAKTPDAIALVLKNQQLTYQELDVYSNRVAVNLVLQGVSKGDNVGLIMNRSIEMIIAILAVLKSGAAYVPVDSNQPVSRTKHIFKECKIRFIIYNVKKLPKALQKSYVCLSPKELDAIPLTPVKLPNLSPEDVAYIMYTSGSTGTPKGVIIQHKNVTNFIHHEIEYLNLKKSDRVFQFSPYSVSYTHLTLPTICSV